MVRQRHSVLARTLTAVVIVLGLAAACSAHPGGGHGGGGGHTFAGGFGRGGFCGGFGHPGFHRYGGFYGYPGFFGYPALFGFGLGLGAGYGLGYGYGYPYAYGYPYGGAYPVYASPAYAAPAAAGAVCPVAAQGGGAGLPPLRLADSDMMLCIRVPPDAVVRINGAKTSQKGPRREFVSSGLSPGRTYTFVVTARWVEPQGRTVEMEQRVHVQGGERRNVDFLAPSSPAADPSEPAESGGPGL